MTITRNLRLGLAGMLILSLLPFLNDSGYAGSRRLLRCQQLAPNAAPAPDAREQPVAAPKDAPTKPVETASTPIPVQAAPIVSQAGAISASPIVNYGVSLDKLTGEECYSLNGAETSRRRAFRAIAAHGRDDSRKDSVPDDSAKLSCTLIGSEDDRRRALAGLDDPRLQDFRSRILVQDYAPDAPMIRRGSFVASGQPTIYLQKPDGTVLARLDRYEGVKTWLTLADASSEHHRLLERFVPAFVIVGAGLFAVCAAMLLRRKRG